MPSSCPPPWNSVAVQVGFAFLKIELLDAGRGERAKPDPRTSLSKAALETVVREETHHNLIASLCLLLCRRSLGASCEPLRHLHRATSLHLSLAPISWGPLSEQARCWQQTGQQGAGTGLGGAGPCWGKARQGWQGGSIPSPLGQRPREWGMTRPERGQPQSDQKLRLPAA